MIQIIQIIQVIQIMQIIQIIQIIQIMQIIQIICPRREKVVRNLFIAAPRHFGDALRWWSRYT